jgi:hypothetical protein
LFIQQICDGDKDNYPEFFFLVTNGSDFENLDLSKTSHAEKELDALEFIDVTKEPVLPKFLAEKIPIFFEKNFEVAIQYIDPVS